AFAQKVRNPTDAVGGWLILNLLRSSPLLGNTTDAAGGLFIPDLHTAANTLMLSRSLSFASDRDRLIRQCVNNPPTPRRWDLFPENDLEFVG
ncbi:MAG TPA: hypothetical protein VLA93_01155, partial [Pyrinomonadaceae bacterium]|nr:hypothetical protein [Pyrinomonadaceae bacterium]